MKCKKCGSEITNDEGYDTVGRCFNQDCGMYAVAVSIEVENES
jgi:hypothetical protein